MDLLIKKKEYDSQLNVRYLVKEKTMKDRNEIKKVDDNFKEELDYKGNPIDPKREYMPK